MILNMEITIHLVKMDYQQHFQGSSPKMRTQTHHLQIYWKLAEEFSKDLQLMYLLIARILK